MFYLTTHSTFYLPSYGVGYIVKNNLDSERENPLPTLQNLLRLAAMVLYMHHPSDMIVHTMAFVTPAVEH